MMGPTAQRQAVTMTNATRCESADKAGNGPEIGHSGVRSAARVTAEGLDPDPDVGGMERRRAGGPSRSTWSATRAATRVFQALMD